MPRTASPRAREGRILMATGARLDHDLLAQLAAQADDESRQHFLGAHPDLLRPESVSWLTTNSQQHLRIDLKQALAFAEAALALANELRNETTIALSLRAKGNALHRLGQNKAASELHLRALGIFEAVGDESETARTLNAMIQPLSLLGDYAGAQTAGERAATLFVRL